jgi:hypothetical protein
MVVCAATQSTTPISAAITRIAVAMRRVRFARQNVKRRSGFMDTDRLPGRSCDLAIITQRIHHQWR